MRTLARVLCAVCVVGAAGCDLFVHADETVRLGNGGSVFGSNRVSSFVSPTFASSAVTVQRFGTAIVDDANLFGGSAFLETPEGGFGGGGDGIEVHEGSVLVLSGSLTGGAVVSLVPPTSLVTRGAAGAGIHADFARVEISGGVLMGGPVASFAGGLLRAFSGPGLSAFQSTVRITGGRFVRGDVQGVELSSTLISPAVLVSLSQLEILDGDFVGDVSLLDTEARILGGRLESLSTSVSSTSSCVEIRGGRIGLLVPFSGRVMIFGTNLIEQPLSPTRSVVTGTFANGAPITIVVDRSRAGVVVFAAPSDPGCPLRP